MSASSKVSRYPISICIACAMHLIWAAGLLMEPQAINATGVYTILVIAQSPTIAAAIFFSVAVMASVGLLFENPLIRTLLIIWQQLILWFSMIGAVHAMYLGTYADGVERVSWFLIVDQIPVVLIAYGHMLALLFIAAEHDGGQ